MRSILSFLILLALFLFNGCADGTGKGEDDASGISKDLKKSRERELDTLDRPKAFLLPTPTQIPALLHNTTVKYYPSVLLKVDTLPSLPKKKDKALQLGGLMIDAAYSGLNDDPSRVKRYAKKIEKLADDVYLGALLKQERIQRLKELADQKAPLTEELLNFYRDAHEEFKRERKKELGFYMVKGAFLEGLYLSVVISERSGKDPWKQIKGQQADYFQNMQKLRKLLFQEKNGKDPVWKELEVLMGQKGKEEELLRKRVAKIREKAFF